MSYLSRFFLCAAQRAGWQHISLLCFQQLDLREHAFDGSVWVRYAQNVLHNSWQERVLLWSVASSFEVWCAKTVSKSSERTHSNPCCVCRSCHSLSSSFTSFSFTIRGKKTASGAVDEIVSPMTSFGSRTWWFLSVHFSRGTADRSDEMLV